VSLNKLEERGGGEHPPRRTVLAEISSDTVSPNALQKAGLGRV
jgi:hypothetical protein